MPIIIPTDTISQAFASNMQSRILIKTRLSNMDNMINPPSTDELNASILDAIASYNLVKPMSSLSFYSVANDVANGNTQIEYLILVGSCYQIMWTLYDDWIHSGDEINLGILKEPDRLNRFAEAMEKFKAEFETLSYDLKRNANMRLSRATFVPTTRQIGWGRLSGAGRRGFKSSFRGGC